jgi:hypothetical protein
MSAASPLPLISLLFCRGLLSMLMPLTASPLPLLFPDVRLKR